VPDPSTPVGPAERPATPGQPAAQEPSAGARGDGERAGPGAGLLAVVGGLALVGAGTAAWVRAEGLRDVGDVAVLEAVATPGSALAPGLAATGIAALLAGLVLTVVRGRVRRWLGLGIVALGAAALAVTVAGIVAAARLPGDLAGGPGTAAAGVVAVVAGGLLALRPPRRAPSVDLDPGERADDPADEWELASVEPDDDARR